MPEKPFGLIHDLAAIERDVRQKLQFILCRADNVRYLAEWAKEDLDPEGLERRLLKEVEEINRVVKELIG